MRIPSEHSDLPSDNNKINTDYYQHLEDYVFNYFFGLTFTKLENMVVLENTGGNGIVTIGNNQYLQPDYLPPTMNSSVSIFFFILRHF